MNQGATHEGLNFAAVRELPVIFVVENNDWSEMTPISETARLTNLADRAASYGMPGLTVDGNDPDAVRTAVSDAAARARGGSGPTLIEAKTVRLMAHYNRDIEHYRTSEDKELAKLRDPLPRLRARLLEHGCADSASPSGSGTEIAEELNSVAEEVLAMPTPDPAIARDKTSSPSPLGAAEKAFRPASRK